MEQDSMRSIALYEFCPSGFQEITTLAWKMKSFLRNAGYSSASILTAISGCQQAMSALCSFFLITLVQYTCELRSRTPRPLDYDSVSIRIYTHNIAKKCKKTRYPQADSLSMYYMYLSSYIFFACMGLSTDIYCELGNPD